MTAPVADLPQPDVAAPGRAPFRPRRTMGWQVTPAARERWVRRRIALTWALLVLNVLTFYSKTWDGLPLLVPIPSSAGKLIAQGALPAALLVALTVNRRLVIRLTGFVATLWLLTPWWGRRDLLLVRCHLAVMSVVLGSVLLGLFLAPSHALSQGRLAGALWPTPPTQVAHYAAVTMGLMVLLWFCGRVGGRVTLATAVVAGGILLLTHTRTALLAMIVGLLVGGLSLFAAKSRVRKGFLTVGVVVTAGALTLSGIVLHWLERGQSAQQLTGLTGRTTGWQLVVNLPRNPFEVLFGFGLSNNSFNGLAIDSN